VREVDVQGFESIAGNPLFSGPNPRYTLESIFILPENTEQLIARITKRAPISEDELERRIESMRNELTYADRCTAKVLNREGKIEETIAQVEKMLSV
jgi:guanylate kinase